MAKELTMQDPGMMNANKPKTHKSMLTGALIGTAIGAVAALLLAPKSGRELRQDVARKSSQASDYAKRQTSTLLEHAKTTVEAAGQKASQISSKVQEIASKAKNQTAMQADMMKETAATTADELGSAAQAVKDHAAEAADEASGHLDHAKSQLSSTSTPAP